ncbi:hypothetical protein [Methylovirgula sp. 4M-Z18]|uniref:hypothetical protein n=1 Tax=Methylovirgula sp. 4M-Z18 TaxID=2293567 RepID=UPI000E2EFEAF|nr:hypothetical protein [Methylovirgula sp. 4M-Z18]RFB79571.1 hypothetical protein DYH55_08745 [Methylovirgula sp. 4M-Z18]
MGELLLFRPRPRRPGAAPLGQMVEAEILFFTGVRYVRDDEARVTIDAPPPGPQKGPGKDARRKKRPA